MNNESTFIKDSVIHLLWGYGTAGAFNYSSARRTGSIWLIGVFLLTSCGFGSSKRKETPCLAYVQWLCMKAPSSEEIGDNKSKFISRCGITPATSMHVGPTSISNQPDEERSPLQLKTDTNTQLQMPSESH